MSKKFDSIKILLERILLERILLERVLLEKILLEKILLERVLLQRITAPKDYAFERYWKTQASRQRAFYSKLLGYMGA